MHNPQARCSPLNSSVWSMSFQWMTLACMQTSPECIGVEDLWEPPWLSLWYVPQHFWIFREMRSLCPLDIFWLWGYREIFILFFCLLCVFVPLRLRKACIKWVAWHSAQLFVICNVWLWWNLSLRVFLKMYYHSIFLHVKINAYTFFLFSFSRDSFLYIQKKIKAKTKNIPVRNQLIVILFYVYFSISTAQQRRFNGQLSFSLAKSVGTAFAGPAPSLQTESCTVSRMSSKQSMALWHWDQRAGALQPVAASNAVRG